MASFHSSPALPLLLVVVLTTGMYACGPAEGRTGDASPDVRTVVLEPVGNQMKYDVTEITATAGSQLKIVFKNTATSPAMVHNVALLEQDAPIEEVGMAAMKAGKDSGFIPDHEALLAYTAMAEPGEEVEVEFTVPPPGEYPYVCLYPGHYVMMRGVLRSEP